VNVRLFANTSTLALTERLEGGAFQPPVMAANVDIHMRFKLAEVVNSAPTVDKRALFSLEARIGYPDTPPVSGSYQLEITYGSTVTTADIAFDATVTAIASAINTAISGIATIHPCTVTEYEGLMRIVFEDKSLQPTFACVENSLWPASFVDVDEIEFDDGWAYVLQLRQAPVAEVATFSEEVPDAPEISELQAGSEVDGYAINAIQKLSISPAFAGGSFIIVRSGKKTTPIAVPVAIDKLSAAVKTLADDGGAFVVTVVNDGVYLEFTGTMGGIDQDLMTIDVFESPGADYFFHLPTKTDAMRTLMRSVDTSGQVRLPLNLMLKIADPLAAGGKQDVTIVQDLVFIRPVSTGEHNVAANLRYGQPLSRADYLTHSTDSLLIGKRAMQFTIGDASATSFALPHNLVENPNAVTANTTTNKLSAAGHNYQDLDPVTFATSGTLPAPLDATVTYFVLNAAENDFQVALTPNGSAVDLTTTGTGSHTARLKDGTVEHVDVVVWQTGGSQLRMSQDTYTVARTSLDVVTVSGFASTPTSGQYDVVVQTFGRPATYVSHAHPSLDETPEAKARIEALEARVALLEAGEFPGTAPASSLSTSAAISRPLPRVWNVMRSRTQPEAPSALLGWNPFAEGSTLRDIRLLPAVHLFVDDIEVLPSVLPAAADSYRDRVFYSATDREDFPGGVLYSGQYAACDGRDWYRIAREGEAGSTWYPTLFNLELFRISISPDELALRTTLDLAFGFEAAMFRPLRRALERGAVARYSLVIERGVRVADATPATTGSNIDTHFGSPVILAQHNFDLTEVPAARRFGLSISRSGAGVLAATATIFNTPSVVSAPATADFVLRARLCRFDVEDLPLDARGIVAVRGLDVGTDGLTDTTLGKYTIG
jgi:hypothetical protein